jgi:hypothetical protein
MLVKQQDSHQIRGGKCKQRLVDRPPLACSESIRHCEARNTLRRRCTSGCRLPRALMSNAGCAGVETHHNVGGRSVDSRIWITIPVPKGDGWQVRQTILEVSGFQLAYEIDVSEISLLPSGDGLNSSIMGWTERRREGKAEAKKQSHADAGRHQWRRYVGV